MNEWMDEWVDGSIDGQTDGLIENIYSNLIIFEKSEKSLHWVTVYWQKQTISKKICNIVSCGTGYYEYYRKKVLENYYPD